ncbi:uncharacterized protein EV420DRAFT_1562926 [Desarmillaria tabescens]|uniref:Uncharacterized protein n=1 Tax=Armillaria tabescens TaxID=1929756 RepID=A0AA39MY98_ARMTA|nr:uncharacterized protein EV420DRAFT_1562926 [Desarmillaria tabescens]KAK0450320.1 hypothetical protein EV420DRAFT_1562926 [Desarmillaria tabescens]
MPVMSKTFSWKYIYSLSLRLIKHMALLSLVTSLSSEWSFCEIITVAKAAKLNDIRNTYNTLNTYINHEILFLRTTMGRRSDAYQLCSSTVLQRCLMSKQRVEALYSNLNRIARNLQVQEGGIQSTVFCYKIFVTAVEGSKSAQNWVVKIKARPPPLVVSDPV